jgi:hypothetical protein
LLLLGRHIFSLFPAGESLVSMGVIGAHMLEIEQNCSVILGDAMEADSELGSAESGEPIGDQAVGSYAGGGKPHQRSCLCSSWNVALRPRVWQWRRGFDSFDEYCQSRSDAL